MPLLSKPCARGGCEVLITSAGKTPSRYAKTRFCSNRCHALHRHSLGTFPPPPMTADERIAAGRKGGLVAGERKRRAAALRLADALNKYITPSMEASLSYRDLTRMKALLARAWNDGRVAERARLRMLARYAKRAARGRAVAQEARS